MRKALLIGIAILTMAQVPSDADVQKAWEACRGHNVGVGERMTWQAGWEGCAKVKSLFEASQIGKMQKEKLAREKADQDFIKKLVK